MEWKLYFALSIAIFMEFAIWGAWAPVLAARLLGPLKMSGKQTGWIYATLPLACIVSPLVAGQLANELASDATVSSMQALIMTAQTGFGMFLGTQFAGIVMDKFRKEEQFQWNKIFMVPGAVALACILVFLSSSRDKRSLWKVMRNSISSASMGDEVSI
jgi:MFS family permease